MHLAVKAVTGKVLYAQISAGTLRNSVDSFFPYLAKFPRADSVAGMGHRWKAGHDLLLDIPQTFARQGYVMGFIMLAM